MRIYIKLVLTAVFWGGTFVAGRIVAREMTPLSAAFLRFLVASACLGIFVLKAHGKIPPLRRDQVLSVAFLGLTGVFAYNALFFSGLKTVTASRASLIIATQPAFIALLSAFIFKERLHFLRVAGIALSISGALVVISRGHPGMLFRGAVGVGDLYIFGCVVSWVAYSLMGKVAMQRMSPLVAVTHSCAVGTVFLLVPALLEGLAADLATHTAAAWTGIFYLGFFGSALGFNWYYEGIKAIGPSRAGVFINLVPVSAITLAFLLLNETVDFSLVSGVVLVSTGIYLTNRPLARSPGR